MNNLDIKYVFKANTGEKFEGGFDVQLLTLVYSADGDNPGEAYLNYLANRWDIKHVVSPESDVVHLEMTVDATTYPLVDDYIIVYHDDRVGVVGGLCAYKTVNALKEAMGLSEEFNGKWVHPDIELEDKIAQMRGFALRKYIKADDKVQFVVRSAGVGVLLNKAVLFMVPVKQNELTTEDLTKKVVIYFNTKGTPCVLADSRREETLLVAPEYTPLLNKHTVLHVVFESGQQVVLVENRATSSRNEAFIASHQ